ncbi:MAG: hypothetical protein SF053_17025, partial [Bacteroidia bacterium]|nr:hypothetical protein [Bacteroidia bacterium]
KSRPEPPEGHENFLPENEHETHAKTSCAECKFQKGNITALGDALALPVPQVPLYLSAGRFIFHSQNNQHSPGIAR